MSKTHYYWRSARKSDTFGRSTSSGRPLSGCAWKVRLAAIGWNLERPVCGRWLGLRIARKRRGVQMERRSLLRPVMTSNCFQPFGRGAPPLRGDRIAWRSGGSPMSRRRRSPCDPTRRNECPIPSAWAASRAACTAAAWQAARPGTPTTQHRGRFVTPLHLEDQVWCGVAIRGAEQQGLLETGDRHRLPWHLTDRDRAVGCQGDEGVGVGHCGVSAPLQPITPGPAPRSPRPRTACRRRPAWGPAPGSAPARSRRTCS